MPKIDNKFTAHFINTTTAPWTPITGLSPTINIRETDGTLVVNNQPLTELWGGHYMFTFSGYNAYKDYLYDINPNDTNAYIQSGVTDDGSLNKALDDLRVWWGWSNLSGISQAIQWSIANMKKALDKKIDEIPQIDLQKIETKIDGVNDSIELAKDEIISNMPTIEKSDFTPVVKKIETVDKKISQYIEWEKKDKEEVWAIARELNKLDMEEEKMKKMKEKEDKKREEEERKKEEEQTKVLLEEIRKEFDNQEEQEKKEKKKELEEEIKEKEKEVKEMKSELNKL